MRSTAALRTFNTLLILLGLFLIVLSYPKLFSVAGNSQNDDRSSIGKILSIKNDARLKKPFLFTWSPLDDDQKDVHHNDLLFTNESSIATIELSKGQEITAKPQTLLKLRDEALEIKNGELELNLKDGGKELKIIVGDNSFTLSPKSNSKLLISSVKGQGKFQVSQGSVNIKTETFNVQANAGEEVLAGASTVSKAQAKLKLVSPLNSTLLKTLEDPVVFEVENSPSSSIIKVTNLSNNKILTSKDKRLLLAPGEYSWQVMDKGMAISHKAFFDVKNLTNAPTLLSPKHLEEIVFYDDNVNVELKWKSPQDALLNVVDQFQNTYYSELLSTNSKLISFSKEGTYDWKLKSDSKLLSSPWSKPRSLIVTRLDYKAGDVAVIELKRPDQLAKFDWEGATAGKFILSKSKDLKNVIYEKELSDQNSIEVPVGKTGIYYWKLIGDKSANFRPKKVIIRPTPAPLKPASPPKIELKLRPKKQSASWFSFFSNAYAADFEAITINFPEIDNAKEYEVEIYSDQNLKNLVQKINTTSPSFEWTPPRAGSYAWRLRYKDHWDRWSPYSDSSMIAATMDFIKPKKVSKVKPAKKARVKQPKKKRIPKQKKIVKKTRSKIKKVSKHKVKKKIYRNSISGFYSPSLVAYESKKDQSLKIDGNALGGHAFSWYQNTTYPIQVEYNSTYGEVFEGESFVSRSFAIGANKNFKFFSIGPSLIINQISDYELSNSTVSNTGEKSTIGAGIVANATINIGSAKGLNLMAQAHLLGLSHISLSLSYDYPYKNRLYLETKLQGSFLNLDTDDGEISSQTFQLLIGPKFKF